MLPDLIPASPNNAPPPPPKDQSFLSGFNQKLQIDSTNIPQSSYINLTTLPNSEDTFGQLLNDDYSMDTTIPQQHQDSGVLSSWSSATPSSSSYTDYATLTHQGNCHGLPTPPSPPVIPQHHHQQQQNQHMSPVTLIHPPQLPDIENDQVISEFERIMCNTNDEVVLANSVCLLFRFSIDSVRGYEVCQAMSTSTDILNHLYCILTDKQLCNDNLIQCYAVGNLTCISKYDKGRAALLGCVGIDEPSIGNEHSISQYSQRPSLGVESLICSLRSRDSDVIVFAITAIHNLLLDRRPIIQEIAKKQLQHGLRYIVQLLGNPCLSKYEFKVIVLDCLQILAYGNRENRLTIKESNGPSLILRTIDENFANKQPAEELIETASRVLKSLSACPVNKIDIIANDGILILTHCIGEDNFEILKTCLWTLRNLSDVISSERELDFKRCINPLIKRIIKILEDYSDEPCIITCALGILANLTCNNEEIKQFICVQGGVEILLQTIKIALKDGRDFRIVDKEILEPAICTLCHLLNQNNKSNLAKDAMMIVMENMGLFKPLTTPMRRVISDDLSKAVQKLQNLLMYQSR